MADHTPGPWESIGGGVVRTQFMLGEGGGSIIADLFRSGRPGDALREADARLIAAAPDLLDACRYTLSEALAYCGEEEADDSPNGEVIRRLRAAIARAEGTVAS